MKKHIFSLIVILVSFLVSASAQSDSLVDAKHKIAIFTPLYLDSAFDGTNEYRYGDDFPKFINPGLEFYEGVQLAIDSLNRAGIPLEVFVYDSRSLTRSLDDQLKEAVEEGAEVLIAHITGRELFQYARVARDNKIPLINVNLPNDGGITANPYYVLLNTTLRTHCEEIYKYLQKNHATDRIIVYRKKGQMEDMIQSYFDNYATVTPSVPLNIRYVDLPAYPTVTNLTASLDSNRNSICIAGSLDTSFTNKILGKLATVAKSYHPLLIGMPIWDNDDFSRPELKGLEIMYTTPFYNARTDKVSNAIVERFLKDMYAKPSDMVVRGYETAWKYSNLLLKYGSDISSNLANNEFNIIRKFDIQPVINKSTLTLDYFENRKLYFVRWLDGAIKSVN